MENELQELEFLDLSDLPEYEIQNLKSFLGGVGHNGSGDVRKSEEQQQPPSDGIGVFHPVQYSQGFNTVEQTLPPYPNPDSIHPLLYQPNVCITSIPPYQPVVSYPIQMLAGGHLVGASPNYYVNSLGPISHHAPFATPPPILNPPLVSNPKRNTSRNKFIPRKDINGHLGDGYSNIVHQPPITFMGAFSGDVVQAVTGVPIVMHQPVSYASTPNVEIPITNSPMVYPENTLVVSTQSTVTEAIVSLPSQQVESHVVEDSPLPVPDNPPTVKPIQSVADAPVPEVNPPNTQPSTQEPSQEAVAGEMTWAGLFKKTSSATVSNEKPTARVEPFTPSSNVAAEASRHSLKPIVDVRIRRLAEHLTSCELVMTPIALLPRGLINKSNWCYINATLQALLACSPFVNLIKSLAKFSGGKTADSTTPILDSMIEFVDQFEVIPVRTGKDRPNKKEEPNFGTSFEPSSVYKMLSKIRSETFKVEGRQEDAEEFLSCVLNGLHDEMIDAVKSIQEDKPPVQPAEQRQGMSDDEDWQVIGPKNRGVVTYTTSYSKTPVSNLFLGQMRSALHYAGAQSTANLQPFFSLQLDIQNEKVNSVRDALACLVSKEPLTGYVCPKTGQVVEASRQTTLEELPPVLILHLKCFVYDKSGGCQKLLKRVDFTSDLELSKDFLSPTQKGKLKERQRQYKLFAVVYHDGKEATKGHYVTEVHHSGTGNWLRYDDSIIRVVDTQLFKYNLPRMPYLLLYKKVNV